MTRTPLLLRSAIGIASLLLLATACVAASVESDRRTEEVMVPMRDGVKLATSLFFPAAEGPWPVVLSRTPYGRTAGASRSGRYVEAGFVYAIQDQRGRGGSQGE